MRLLVLGSFVCALTLRGAIGPTPAMALPPPSVALAQSSLTGARWIEHFVIPGERLAEIASRYAVDVGNIVEWNALDSDKPMLRVGQRLRVLSRSSAAPRKRQRYKVVAGDNWAKIARRFDVDPAKLQKQWNPALGDLLPGDHVVIWVERDNPAAGDSEPEEAQPEPPRQQARAVETTLASTLAAVVEPTHGANTKLAATLASVVELHKPVAAVQASKPQATTAQAAKPQPVVQASKPQPVVQASKPQPVVQASKPQPVVQASKPPAQPQPAKPSNVTAKLAAIVVPKSQSQSQAAKEPKLALAVVTEQKPSARGVQPAPKLTPRPPSGLDAFPIVPVAPGGYSLGTPTRGHVRDAVQLPENPRLYTVRNLDHSWGSTLAVESIQRGFAIFRQRSGFAREIMICDMGLRTGGRLRPHRSHTSGRDVDIRLPLREGVPAETIPENPAVVDWDAAWQLVKSLVATGQVHYVFLARSRQVPLYKAALRAGETEASLVQLMQYPGHGRNTLVRHSAGHTKHIHVRWKCAADEAQCVDP